jgi:N-acetylglutamate synthase-like GNAT family acetyltransferase
MATDLITIRAYAPHLAEDFKTINEQWIKSMFMLEDEDKNMLNNPEQQIINRGGEILFAEHTQLGVIGTSALIKRDDGYFELTKMGVLESARGLKIGETLLQAVLDKSKAMNIENLFLLTNKKCAAAIHLYEKFGFEHSDFIMQRFASSYQRCNVAMLYRY